MRSVTLGVAFSVLIWCRLDAQDEIDCRISSMINGTTDPLDDFVVLSDSSLLDRPFTALRLTLASGLPDLTVRVVENTGNDGALGFSTKSDFFTLKANQPVTVQVFGNKASLKEGDARYVVRGSGFTCKELGTRFTVVTGIKIRYKGTFYYATSNAAPMPGIARQCTDTVMWGQTPLPCEKLVETNQMFIEDGMLSKQRAIPKAMRPQLEVLVTEVKSFGPEIELNGRDQHLKAGTQVRALAERDGVLAVLVPDACNNGDLEFEQVLNFGYRFGTAFSLRYPNNDGETISHVWRFNVFSQPGLLPLAKQNELRAIDFAAVPSFFPGSKRGCPEKGISYVENVTSNDMTAGSVACKIPLNLKQHFINSAGHRGMFRIDWANWTSRKLVALAEKDFEKSFIARLFAGAIKGQPLNQNDNPDDDTLAEGFMQLTEYDWYTLMGQIEKGAAATPGGIDKVSFPEFLVANGCPQSVPLPTNKDQIP